MRKAVEEEKFIRLEEVTLDLEGDESILSARAASILGVPLSHLLVCSVVKKSIDSRRKSRILLVYSLDVRLKNQEDYLQKLGTESEAWPEILHRHKFRVETPYKYELCNSVKSVNRPVVVGSGPSGLFAALLLAEAGLCPLVLERGYDLDGRVKAVENFFAGGQLDLNGNVQFGEGGAGTFSDGKLYTMITDSRKKYIFDCLIEAGAPPEIAYEAHPHIGTDRLRSLIKNIRLKIISLGGEFRFKSCLSDLDLKNEKLVAAVLSGGEKISASELVLAIGHSARDTYQMLYERGIKISAKPFAIGVRIEHLANAINRSQYGYFYNHPKLPTARYKLVAHLPDNPGRSVYTFCMCPGGYVVAAASENNLLAVNGMSEYARDGKNSNSALLVGVTPEDFGSDHPLAGVEFQRKWEKLAFAAGGGAYRAPVQLVGDFLVNKSSSEIRDIKPSYRPGFKPGSLSDCLPDYVIDSLRKALPIMDGKIKGFAHYGAVLTGVETRSSSPVRFWRDESFQSNIAGIYPAGEGAGYAGGIISSAIDGMKVAEAIIKKYSK